MGEGCQKFGERREHCRGQRATTLAGKTIFLLVFHFGSDQREVWAFLKVTLGTLEISKMDEHLLKVQTTIDPLHIFGIFPCRLSPKS